ncbi:hypothetical protein GCM10025866_02960 [Naasia aerilata]|uniref:Uncharacterized protein n=1 Tax=Naasia aerilata TaxID=1162966 RepID=A0ABM8G8F8_9MICO|nr:hypothetical protein GCM10025866_02960 [Naasia aerilata]
MRPARGRGGPHLGVDRDRRRDAERDGGRHDSEQRLAAVGQGREPAGAEDSHDQPVVGGRSGRRAARIGGQRRHLPAAVARHRRGEDGQPDEPRDDDRDEHERLRHQHPEQDEAELDVGVRRVQDRRGRRGHPPHAEHGRRRGGPEPAPHAHDEQARQQHGRAEREEEHHSGAGSAPGCARVLRAVARPEHDHQDELGGHEDGRQTLPQQVQGAGLLRGEVGDGQERQRGCQQEERQPGWNAPAPAEAREGDHQEGDQQGARRRHQSEEPGCAAGRARAGARRHRAGDPVPEEERHRGRKEDAGRAAAAAHHLVALGRLRDRGDERDHEDQAEGGEDAENGASRGGRSEPLWGEAARRQEAAGLRALGVPGVDAVPGQEDGHEEQHRGEVQPLGRRPEARLRPEPGGRQGRCALAGPRREAIRHRRDARLVPHAAATREDVEEQHAADGDEREDRQPQAAIEPCERVEGRGQL